MDTKLMAATNLGDVKKLLEEATAMVELAATSKEPTKEDQSPAANINPLLLASTRTGSWEALNALLEREDAKMPPMVIPTQEFLELLASGPDARDGRVVVGDVEEGVEHQPAASLAAAAGALLKGVTRDGDTALHAVARSHKGGQHFLKYAGIIYDRDRSLLFEKNHNGNTPLHCAARAGNFDMVSHLIDLAGRVGPQGKLTLLRMENKGHETALHEAIRFEHGRRLGPKDREALFDADGTPAERIRAFVDQQGERSIVKLLMGADPQLADYPAEGISPLYLAIFLDKSSIALTLYYKSGGNLSYTGADGQNALHVALLRNAVLVELLLDWNKGLTTQLDNDGSVPLHFASSMGDFWTGSYLRLERLRRPPWFRFEWLPSTYSRALPKVFEANPAALYQEDKNGFSPIHVAASVGARNAIKFFLWKRPDSAGLRDAKGKTFLHVATEKQRLSIVSYVCGNPSLAWILNMQDNDGNTALHLAIQAESYRMFCALFGNRAVNLNLTNNQGETPCDISESKIPRGMGYALNSERLICRALVSVGANFGAFRSDKSHKTEEKYTLGPKPEEEDKQSKSVKDATQAFVVASVLITTMAFSALFAIPGGYRADDHKNGGTPTFAGRYIFDAFIMATTLAFICSSLATVGFMLAGVPSVNLNTRKNYLLRSIPLMASSVECLGLAFALAVYMLLAPVARNTAFMVCATISVVPLYVYAGHFQRMVHLVRPLFIRKGPKRGMKKLLHLSGTMLATLLWPFILSFGWATLARIHHHG